MDGGWTPLPTRPQLYYKFVTPPHLLLRDHDQTLHRGAEGACIAEHLYALLSYGNTYYSLWMLPLFQLLCTAAYKPSYAKTSVRFVLASPENKNYNFHLSKEEERQITEEFERQKDELRDKILTKETQLANTQLELNNLEEYRELQQKQSDRIAGTNS